MAVTQHVLRVVSAKLSAGVFPLLAKGQNAGVGLTQERYVFTVLRTLNTGTTPLPSV